MKRYITFLTAILTASTLVWAGELTGMHELSLSGQAGQVTTKDEYTYHYPYQANMHTYEDVYDFATLVFRYGYFVYKGLEIEPEFHWSAIQDVQPALSIHANAAYNFDISRTGSRARVFPFILAGYGIGNAAPVYHAFWSRNSENFDVPVLNAGAGLKAFVSERVALRVEYRYQKYEYDRTYSDFASVKSTDSYNNVFFGFSIFFPPKGHSAASETGGCGGCGPAK